VQTKYNRVKDRALELDDDMKQSAFIIVMIIAIWIPPGLLASATEGPRFFHSGDGKLSLISEKNGRAFEGVYRRAAGDYDETALRAIYRVFDAPYDDDFPKLSLRLIAFLDFLEDRLRPGARITITSGYRSPAYNTGVRNRGGLAAKASLHQYGMAADFVMDGVPSERVWDTVKSLGFGGAGYYHGRTVHVDVGPARSWDEKTSGVGTDISDDNKLIGLVTDFDVYRPGETMTLRFIRMTAFPIGVMPSFTLGRKMNDGAVAEAITFAPTFAEKKEGDCPQFDDIDQMAAIQWQLPTDLPPGRYEIYARFCGRDWEAMPPEVATPIFEVAAP
jgi:uncharacterized protein YcbK (DUF882 family)